MSSTYDYILYCQSSSSKYTAGKNQSKTSSFALASSSKFNTHAVDMHRQPGSIHTMSPTSFLDQPYFPRATNCLPFLPRRKFTDAANHHANACMKCMKPQRANPPNRSVNGNHDPLPISLRLGMDVGNKKKKGKGPFQNCFPRCAGVCVINLYIKIVV